jgi:hypothetical protein
LACELLASPSVIFADEPTTGKHAHVELLCTGLKFAYGIGHMHGWYRININFVRTKKRKEEIIKKFNLWYNLFVPYKNFNLNMRYCLCISGTQNANREKKKQRFHFLTVNEQNEGKYISKSNGLFFHNWALAWSFDDQTLAFLYLFI